MTHSNSYFENQEERKRLGVAISTNIKETFALVDEEGNIIEKFRLKMTAIINKEYYERNLGTKLKVVRLK